MSVSYLLNSNNLNLYAATLTLTGLTQSQNTTPPLIITSTQPTYIANLYAERAYTCDVTSGNINGDSTLTGYLATTGNISVGTYLEVTQDAYIGDDLLVTGFSQVGANASVGTDLDVGGQLTAGNVTSFQLESTATTGTPPLIVASTTQVDNLKSEFSGTSDVTLALKTATGTVVVSAATHPTNGQILSYNGATGVWVDATTPTGNVDLNVVDADQVNANVLNIADDADILGNLTVDGDLTVNGIITGNITSLLDFTGAITATNGVTSVGAQTGTGSTFVMQSSPTLTTPNIGVASGTSLDVSGALQGATVTADATTNQIVLGTTNTTTISSTTPSASRVVTLHDAGAASNFVLNTGGAMTISNAGTTGYVLTATGATSSSWQASGGMGALSSVHVTLTHADILQLSTVPYVIIPAQGAGTTQLVHSATFVFTFGGLPNYAGGGDFRCFYSTAINALARPTDIFTILATNIKQSRDYYRMGGSMVGADGFYLEGGGTIDATTTSYISNADVVLLNRVSDFTGGHADSTIDVWMTYEVITF